MDPPEFLLSGVAVGDPDLGLMPAQDPGGHRPGAAGGDGVQHGLSGMEHPLPVGHAVDPGRGLVRGDHRGAQQFGLDRRTGRVERRTHAPEGIGDSALGDAQSEQFPQHPREPLETDMMAMVKIGQQRADTWAEGRPRRHGGGRGGPVAPPTSAASAAEQLDPCHHRSNFGQIDVVVAVTTPLGGLGRRRPAMWAGFRQTALGPVRIIGQGARNSGAGRPRLAPTLSLAGRTTGAVLGRRIVRIGRRLPRLPDQGLKFRNPRRQTLDQRRLLDKQGVLLSLTQAVTRRLLHPYVHS
jgi:hypothetical protein